ncbi:hypothetical protein GLAREA_00030 [Glarea lozoyensis ATCC 20868]|uniref:Uncharacterized protein n=1 Tax=Glarea lozoyensis (strain ATCC 20868 / MF5171) TaxID=1116229 RepID=S3CR06_GLAL2|nr:uncharacterized protein GLAREA_00030 [Glarea lozoyensis ATCC 20868]EPE28872.1 hypothetical protein GLAREA_00030 [Glarea lozoyensis ATCC 20868]
MQKTGPDAIKTRAVFVVTVVPWLFRTASAISVKRTILQLRSGIGIDWSPAPSPEKGPPASAGATRDKTVLPAEIGGIVGAYLFCLCIVALTLLTCAGKRRRRALSPRRHLDVEMVVASPPTLYIDPTAQSPSLKSPRNFSWPSPEKDEHNPYVYPVINRSPITPPGTDPYVDSRIVQHDKEMAARNLEDIYAHVMEQEEAKAQGLSPKDLPSPVQLQRPGSIPTPAPQRGGSPKKADKSRRPSNITLDDDKSTKSRASSILSALSPRRKTAVRPLQISSPLPTPKSMTFPGNDEHGDREPLSPKYYKPPPPVPTDQVPYNHSRNNSSIAPASPTRSIAEQLAPYGPGGPGNQRHRNYPSQTSVQSIDPPSATTTTSQTPIFIPQSKRAPPPLHPIPTASNPPSTNASTRTLPFRQFDTGLKSPSFKPATKTTVLERKEPQHSGPATAGLKTPWSAGAVPYSPFYQPFTPMIPVTPRLITKEDRKVMKKQEKKLGQVQELIKSEDDLWDSGY